MAVRRYPSKAKVKPYRRSAANYPLLRCPVTDEQLEVVFLPWAGAYTVRGGFDPSDWHTPEELEAALGVDGKLLCPYTGREVTLVLKGTLARADGAFSLRQLWREKEHALHDISFREGVAPSFPRDGARPRIVVGEERRRESDPTVGLGERSALVEGVVKEILA